MKSGGDLHGVVVKHVGDLTIAGDQRLVEVRMAIDVASRWISSGSSPGRVQEGRALSPTVERDLRARSSAPAGPDVLNKYIAVDFARSEEQPPPELARFRYGSDLHPAGAAMSLHEGPRTTPAGSQRMQATAFSITATDAMGTAWG